MSEAEVDALVEEVLKRLSTKMGGQQPLMVVEAAIRAFFALRDQRRKRQ